MHLSHVHNTGVAQSTSINKFILVSHYLLICENDELIEGSWLKKKVATLKKPFSTHGCLTFPREAKQTYINFNLKSISAILQTAKALRHCR